MHAIVLIIGLALAQFIYFCYQVGLARKAYGVAAPATSGHEGFERRFRVQMNTLELLVTFVPSLWLASTYVPPWVTSLLGLIYLIGRFLYARSYVAEPASRTVGFLLSIVPIFVLVLIVIVGALIGMLS